MSLTALRAIAQTLPSTPIHFPALTILTALAQLLVMRFDVARVTWPLRIGPTPFLQTVCSPFSIRDIESRVSDSFTLPATLVPHSCVVPFVLRTRGWVVHADGDCNLPARPLLGLTSLFAANEESGDMGGVLPDAVIRSGFGVKVQCKAVFC